MKCPDCGDECVKLWNFKNPDMEDPDQRLSEFMLKSIEEYNNQKKTFPTSGDHYSGSCMVIFRGDKNLCDNVVDFITQRT